MREIRKHGVTRHIICIRHGQYDETHKEDEKRVLTPLGRQQAALTGQRLAEWLGADVPIRSVRVSNMTRAKETAAIIATYLPGIQIEEPDPMINEGRPCHHIPSGKNSSKTIQTTDDNHPRIEAAFEKYFHRADYDEEKQGDGHHHEVEIIVCHANVIRYFLCRALQLPPEAWLRYCPFNCSMTYFTIRPTGTVSCRMVVSADLDFVLERVTHIRNVDFSQIYCRPFFREISATCPTKPPHFRLTLVFCGNREYEVTTK
eukprot:scaffold3953_cov169-Amphora_coffeaeformis.AAC.17